MRTNCVVLASPMLNDDFSLHKIVEQLDIEAFVAQTTVKRFIIPILPWTSWFDVKCFRANASRSFSDGFRAELTPVV